MEQSSVQSISIFPIDFLTGENQIRLTQDGHEKGKTVIIDVNQENINSISTDLAVESSETIKKSECINFQGKRINLNRLFLPNQWLNEFLIPEVVTKLANQEKLIVGNPLCFNTNTRCYIARRLTRLKTSYSEREIFSHPKLETQKIFLISAISGMGKTTFLTKLSTSIKESFPHLWVVKINLNLFTNYFEDCQKKLKSVSLLDLINSIEESRLKNDFERKFFTLKERVVILVDGIDKINYAYRNITCKILRECMRKTNIKKIVITTSPGLLKNLKLIFSVEHFELQPLKTKEQVNFLTRYWVKSLGLKGILRRKCKLYATKLIKSLSWINRKNKDSSSGVPWQLIMLAELFQEDKSGNYKNWECCKEFLVSEKCESELPKKLNVAWVYGIFTDEKFLRVHKDDWLLLLSYKAYFRKLALETLLTEDQCHNFQCYDEVETPNMEDLLKIGIVHKIGHKLDFSHRRFAEYFLAEAIYMELKRGYQSTKFRTFFLTNMLTKKDFCKVRIFLDKLLKTQLGLLPRKTFEAYDFLKTPRKLIFEEKAVLQVIAEEGCLYVLRLFFHCFKYIKPVHPLHHWFTIAKTKPGNSVDVKLNTAETLLHIAASNGHLPMVKFLVNDQNADVSIENSSGFTPLNCAAQRGHLKVVKCLVEDFWAKIGGKTLHIAAMEGHLDIIKYLLQRGIIINTLPGCQALHFAASKGHLHIIKYLLSHDIDVNVKDVFGYSPLTYAQAAGQTRVVKFLESRGAVVNHQIPPKWCENFIISSFSKDSFLEDYISVD